MTLQAMRDVLTRRPFSPLRVRLAGGESYEVRRPESVFLTKTELVVGTDFDVDGVPAEFKILSLSHVTSIEPLINAA